MSSHSCLRRQGNENTIATIECNFITKNSKRCTVWNPVTCARNTPYSRWYPPSLHALFFFSINDVSETWSFRRQTKLMFKFAKYEKSLPSLFIPSNKTIRQFKTSKLQSSSFDKLHVIIAFCEEIFGHYCIPKNNRDHFHLKFTIIAFKIKRSWYG